MYRLLVSLVCSLSFLAHAQLEVTAVVSQNPVSVGQSFTLEITANESLPAHEFDGSMLLKQGFVVGNTSTSRQHSSINGVSSTQTRWITSLLVRKEGSYLIPSFNIGGVRTTPINLKAKELTASEPNEEQVRFEVSMDRSSTYVEQAVRYTAKIWVANSLEQANILAPSMANAKVVKLGDDQQDFEIVDGKRYRTLQRHWLITPKQAGSFDVIGPRLSGLAADRYGRNRPVDIKAQRLSMEVKNPPAGVLNWLPSDDVLLDDELQPQQNSYTQGQAFSRKITLTIAGITEQQLPEIDIDYGEGFRVYPEEYQDRTIVQDGVVFAQRVQTVALIPSQSGELSLPGWSLDWWDITQDKAQTASIEARTLQILPAASSSLQLAQSQAPVVVNETSSGLSFFTWLFALLWLGTCGAWAYSYTRRPLAKAPAVSEPTEESITESEQAHWQAFKQACNQQDSLAAEQHLAKWIEQSANQHVSAELAELHQRNWSAAKPNQDLKALYQRAKANKKLGQQKAESEDSALPELNPRA